MTPDHPVAYPQSPTSSPQSPTSSLGHSVRRAQASRRRGPRRRPTCRSPPRRAVLGTYGDPRGRPREVVAIAGPNGGVLVVDRDLHTLSDPRLVARLAPDEPRENAGIVCGHYLSDPGGRRCRPVLPEDLWPDGRDGSEVEEMARGGDLVDRHGRRHRLGTITGRLSIPELRWLRGPRPGRAGEALALSLREVVADLEAYEPAHGLTVAALARHAADRRLSVAVLRGELARLDASRIVLNRGLRQAVRHAVEREGLSLSEIALRCGRVKRDAQGHASGETSWLARRVGLLAEAGEEEPTPWIHSDVLALISRCGLGISPHEVEL
jgi:hypothetical protein